MSEIKFTLQGVCQHTIPVRHWPTNKPRAVIIILHGLAEHSGRYQRLAVSLNKAGYAAVAIDHRGHGQETPVCSQGLFGYQGGWQNLLSDVDQIHKKAVALYPDIPVIVFGHSMGSFITLSWLLQRPEPLDGVVLSGSGYNSPLMLKLGAVIAAVECLRQGTNGHSKLIDTLTFGSYNSAFKPVRTAFDWLSRDKAEVDNYITDPCCGFQGKNGLWRDMFTGLQPISSVKALSRIQPKLPFYIFGGSMDPIGSQGRGLQKLSNKLAQAGIANISLKIWPGGRHEMLNEINRDEVIASLIQWLDQQVPK